MTAQLVGGERRSLDGAARRRRRQALARRQGRPAGEHATVPFYNVVKPDYGPDWQLRAQVQFLFPR